MYNLTSTVAGGITGGILTGGAALGTGGVLPIAGIEAVAMTTGGLLLIVGGLLLDRWARVNSYRSAEVAETVRVRR